MAKAKSEKYGYAILLKKLQPTAVFRALIVQECHRCKAMIAEGEIFTYRRQGNKPYAYCLKCHPISPSISKEVYDELIDMMNENIQKEMDEIEAIRKFARDMRARE